MICCNVTDQVVTLPVSGEVFLGIVDEMICADRADHVQIRRAGYSRHLGPEGFGNLHSKCSHATTRTVDQYFLPGLDLSMVTKGLQGGESGYGDPGSFRK